MVEKLISLLQAETKRTGALILILRAVSIATGWTLSWRTNGAVALLLSLYWTILTESWQLCQALWADDLPDDDEQPPW